MDHWALQVINMTCISDGSVVLMVSLIIT